MNARPFIVLSARPDDGSDVCIGEAETLGNAIDIARAAVSDAVPKVLVYQAIKLVRAETHVHVEEFRAPNGVPGGGSAS